jgi:hypothetical protein
VLGVACWLPGRHGPTMVPHPLLHISVRPSRRLHISHLS